MIFTEFMIYKANNIQVFCMPMGIQKWSCPGFSNLDGVRRLGDSEVNKENNDNNNKPVPDSPPPPNPECLQKPFLRSHSEYLSRQPARTNTVQVTDLNNNIFISCHDTPWFPRGAFFVCTRGNL